MRKLICFVPLLLGGFIGSDVSAQPIQEKVESEETNVSRVLKASGSLIVREGYGLPSMQTMKGNDIDAEIVVIRSLLGTSGNPAGPQIGLRLSVKAEYSESAAFVDMEEIEGLIASIELIDKKGQAELAKRSVVLPDLDASSTQLTYTTKEGLSLTVFDSEIGLRYALRVSSSAEWKLLRMEGSRTFKSNLAIAVQAGNQLD